MASRLGNRQIGRPTGLTTIGCDGRQVGWPAYARKGNQLMENVRTGNDTEPPAEDLRVVKTRRALHGALARLMAEHEYSKITITMLAREACVNRKTFYMHYQNVDDLVAEVLADDIRGICRRAVEEAEASDGSCGLKGLTRLLLASIHENVDEELNLVRNVQLLKLSEMVIDPLEEFFASELARRGLPEKANMRGDIACYAGCVLAGYAQWRFADTGETLDDVAARVNRMAAGIAPELL